MRPYLQITLAGANRSRPPRCARRSSDGPEEGNEDGGPDVCSSVCDGEVLLNLADGLLSCLNVSDGKMLWEHDLRAYFLASPSLVGDKLYLLDEDGTMFIGEYKPKYKELAKCKLEEKCHASPAFIDGRIYIRGFEHLYCIGEKTTAEP